MSATRTKKSSPPEPSREERIEAIMQQLRPRIEQVVRQMVERAVDVPEAQEFGAIDTEFIRSNFPQRAALKDQDGILSPDAIAEVYWQLHLQPRSAWTHEMDLRPWIETW